MKVAGIIAEYNPFHNGHAYHLKKTRQLTGADYVIAVISGDFTQRGTPAITDKYTRTRMALEAGVDLVLELPVCYACSSAEYFALGGVSLLNRLGVVDFLCFGSECGQSEPLLHAAEILLEEPEEYRRLLQAGLKEGSSYPKARSLALSASLGKGISQSILQTPNNILGTEYCKALLRLSSRIKPVTLKREGNSYHDPALAHTAGNAHEIYSSASAIRHTCEALFSEKNSNITAINGHLPDPAYRQLLKAWGNTFPMEANDFSHPLRYRLLTESVNGFHRYLDVSPAMSDKIIKNLYRFESFSSFCDILKSKDITHTRISRSLLHILLNIKTSGSMVEYARILGLRREAGPLFSAIKKHTDIVLLSKLADASSLLTPKAMQMLNQDILAAHIYDSGVFEKFRTPFVCEYEKQIITV